MALDPQVATYLAQMAALGLPAVSDMPLEEARRQYEEGAAPLFGDPAAVESAQDVDADGVPARLYRPAAGELPALVYHHGGGWVLGSRESHDPLCRTIAARSGCAVLAVEYRLAPEHAYPTAVQDAWAATAWAAERFPALAVGGDSAGGQLAAAVALRARERRLPLALQALVYPVTNYAFDTESYREHAEGSTLTAEQMRWFWEQYVQDPTRAEEPDCSPLRARELAGVAPALVLTAEYDPLRDEGEAYAHRLEQAGVPVTLSRYHGLVHGFIRMPAVVDRAQEAIDQLAGAVRAALRTAPAAFS